MFSLIDPKIVVSYVVAACMVLVGGASALIHYGILLGVIDASVATGIPSLDIATGLFFAGLAVFGYRRTQERQMQQQESLKKVIKGE